MPPIPVRESDEMWRRMTEAALLGSKECTGAKLLARTGIRIAAELV